MTHQGGNSPASHAEGDTSVTRVTRVALPPPPIAGLRTVARQRGAFDESLKTLRLPALPPRAAIGEVATIESDERGTTARPFSPSSMLRSGPRLVAPTSIVEELEDADVVDDDPAATLERKIDPATTLERAIDPADTLPGLDPADTLVGDPADTLVGDVQGHDAAAWSRAGAPVEALEDDRTPIVHVPHLVVPPPAVLVHTILAPTVAPRPRRWVLVIAAPLAAVAIALGLAAWSMETTPADVTTITASLPDVQVREPVAAPRIETPAVVPAAIVPAAIVPAPVVPAREVEPVAVAPTVPPPPPAMETHVDANVPTTATPSHGGRTRSKTRTHARSRTAKPQLATAAASTPEPTVVRRVPAAASDATALLREAERAFAEGRYATALHFADRSRAKAPDPRAARIAALAACRIGQAQKAKAAYLALPGGQRASVRKQCLDRGIALE
jgi:hypothetical protein